MELVLLLRTPTRVWIVSSVTFAFLSSGHGRGVHGLIIQMFWIACAHNGTVISEAFPLVAKLTDYAVHGEIVCTYALGMSIVALQGDASSNW